LGRKNTVYNSSQFEFELIYNWKLVQPLQLGVMIVKNEGLLSTRRAKYLCICWSLDKSYLSVLLRSELHQSSVLLIRATYIVLVVEQDT